MGAARLQNSAVSYHMASGAALLLWCVPVTSSGDSFQCFLHVILLAVVVVVMSNNICMSFGLWRVSIPISVKLASMAVPTRSGFN